MSPVVVVPTYNEAENLPLLVEQVMTLPDFRMLVVDDNSRDGTGQLAEELSRLHAGRIDVLHRDGKLGLGTAYLEGFRTVLERKYRYIFQMDADFSHDPADLPRLLAELRAGADLVIGSRYVAGGGTRNWPFWRKTLSRGGSLYARTILGLPIEDLTGGFRGWQRHALLGIGLDRVRSEGYSFQVEMAYRCARRGGKVIEVPIIFTERRNGVSKMSKAIFIEAVATIWRLRLEDVRLPRMLRQVLAGR